MFYFHYKEILFMDGVSGALWYFSKASNRFIFDKPINNLYYLEE